MKVIIAAIEIIGAFLLAVEAIKIENIFALERRIFNAARWLLPIDRPEREEIDDDGWDSWHAKFIVMGIFGLVVAVFALGFFSINPWDILPSNARRDISAFGLIVIVGVVGVTIMGVLVYMALMYGLTYMLRAAEWIEKNTPNGGVGITGFLFFTTAALLKLAFDH